MKPSTRCENVTITGTEERARLVAEVVLLPNTPAHKELLLSCIGSEWLDHDAVHYIIILAVGPGGWIPSTFKLNQGILNDPDAPDPRVQFTRMQQLGLVKQLVALESRALIIEASMQARLLQYKSVAKWKKRKKEKRKGAQVLGCYPPWPLQMWTNGKNCENKRSPFASMQTAAAGGECPLLQETHFIMIQETKKKDKRCLLDEREKKRKLN